MQDQVSALQREVASEAIKNIVRGKEYFKKRKMEKMERRKNAERASFCDSNFSVSKLEKYLGTGRMAGN